MTPNLWHNCNNVFHIRLETTLAPDFDVIPKSGKCPWALHKKENLKGLPMHEMVDWDTTKKDRAPGLGNAVDRTSDHANCQKQNKQKRPENIQASPAVVNTSPVSRSSQQKPGSTMRHGGASEGEITLREISKAQDITLRTHYSWADQFLPKETGSPLLPT